jgi:hypothetical protein
MTTELLSELLTERNALRLLAKRSARLREDLLNQSDVESLRHDRDLLESRALWDDWMRKAFGLPEMDDAEEAACYEALKLRLNGDFRCDPQPSTVGCR